MQTATKDFAPIDRRSLGSRQEPHDDFGLRPVDGVVKRIDVLCMAHKGDDAMLIRGNERTRHHIGNQCPGVRIGRDDNSPVKRTERGNPNFTATSISLSEVFSDFL